MLPAAADGEEGEEQDPDAALLKEMEDVKSKMEARLKREKKNRREMKKKAKIRALQVRREGAREVTRAQQWKGRRRTGGR